MDPMDYTMDDSQPGQQSNNPHRYQCQQPQGPPAGMSYGSPREGGHRYDPVHDASGPGYQASSTNSWNQNQYAGPPNFGSQWPNNLASHQPWTHYAGIQQQQQIMPQNTESSHQRIPSRSYVGMPSGWDAQGSRGVFDPPFGYNPYTPTSMGNPTSDANRATESVPPPAGIAYSSQLPIFLPDRHALRGDISYRSRNQPSTSFDTSTRPREEPSSQHQHRPHPSLGLPFSEPRYANPRNNGRNPYSHRSNPSGDTTAAARRRVPPPPPSDILHPMWTDSDEEEELANNPLAFRRTEMFLGPHGFSRYERNMASIRGAMSNKRIPSKEAISSLEKVDITTLDGDDRTCSICYSELGIENPEGVLENPIRLPKCKHLFGDQCIKKWFEENDTCPYCRDKLPSEVSISKRGGHEIYLAQRNRLIAQMRRQSELASVYGNPSDESAAARLSTREPAVGVLEDLYADLNRASAASARLQDEEEFQMTRELWGYSPGRTSGNDSPESRRRQQARGRVGSGRAAHAGGRPNSVGSARWATGGASNQNPTQRAQYLPPQMNHGWSQSTRVSTSPGGGLHRQNSTGGSATSDSADAASPQPRSRRTQIETRPSTVQNSLSQVQASPPVAVGSGIVARTGHSSDLWAESDWRPAARTAPNEMNTNSEPTATSHTTPSRPDASMPVSHMLSDSSPPPTFDSESNFQSNGIQNNRWSR